MQIVKEKLTMLFSKIFNWNLAEISEPQLLTQQLEFIQKANEQLVNSFNSFIQTVNSILLAIPILLGILGVVGTFFYGKTLNDAKKRLKEDVDIIERQIKEQVNEIVAERIGRRVDYIQRIVEREQVVDFISVEYFLPRNSQPPIEFNLLKHRGFRSVIFRYQVADIDRKSQVVVLDLENYQCNDDQVKDFLEQMVNHLSSHSALVIYRSEYSPAINEFKKNKKMEYYHSANSRISLMGAVVDAAYVVDGLRFL